MDDNLKKNVQDYLENRKKVLADMSAADRAEMIKDFEQPSLENLMKMVDSLGGVTPEDKEKLRKKLFQRAAAAAASGGVGGGGDDKILPTDFLNNQKNNLLSASSDYEYYLFAIMVIMIICVFGKI